MYYFESTHFGTVVGMFDDFEEPGSIKHGRSVLGPITAMSDLFKTGVFDSAAIGIGYRHRHFRKEMYLFLKKIQIPIVTYIHPSAHVEPSAQIGEGAIVLVDCAIDMHADIQENVFISSRCFISHDVSIKGHTYCAPNVSLAGHTQVGEGCFLGISTTTVDGVYIGDYSQSAAGAVVTKQVPENVLVAGVPAVVKKHLAADT